MWGLWATGLEVLVLDAMVTMCGECIAAQRQDSSIIMFRIPADKDGLSSVQQSQGFTECGIQCTRQSLTLPIVYFGTRQI